MAAFLLGTSSGLFRSKKAGGGYLFAVFLMDNSSFDDITFWNYAVPLRCGCVAKLILNRSMFDTALSEESIGLNVFGMNVCLLGPC